MAKTSPLKSYRFSLILLLSLVIGSVTGLALKERAVFFKPFGDIFLNLLFTSVVPLVFFSISSAVASMSSGKRLGKILSAMMLIFIVTGIISSILMVIAVKVYPPAQGIGVDMPSVTEPEAVNVSAQIVKAFTVSDFGDLLSKKNMLALIIFSLLIGLGASHAGDKGRAFTQFLMSGNEVMGKVIGYIMYYAPVGLGAYFAYLVGVFGPELFGSYLRAMKVYYPLAFFYFIAAFSLYAFLAAGQEGIKRFWKNIIPASLTALATGSSVATIPTSLEAAKKIGIPEDIREVVIPIGATIHMEGSCLSAILKIALLFGLYQMDFSSPAVLLTAIGVALLSGTVMSGIPSGGFLGEILIVTLYGFPIEALPLISMIGVLVDPPATMVNAVGDNVSSMMVARLLGGPKWLPANENS
ncbi:MAG TPA: dicarboxylate/amino acid:cation symporter [Candidatus Omnitrophota bacterium]|nr:dicarboxylate/amino acid:cation symporter [Candidatus Omnitrophota bacterium]